MTILDTNVLSELFKPRPDERVRWWVAEQPASSLFTTSITQAEILYGVLLLPKGRRRQTIEKAIHAIFSEDFSGRVLSFDAEAAVAYASIAMIRRQSGLPISQFDAQIAAIARRTRAVLATRNIADFRDCGVELINPWDT